jgi:Uma2 family endonuclease
LEGAPTLVVEVMSPSTARVDRNTKLQILEASYRAPERFVADRLVDLPPFPGLRLDPLIIWP